MSLVEYLYVDEKRLDSYFEQISSPVAYDKVPVWKAGLSVTTLGADATQSRFPRPFTTYEKIAKVKEYLESNDLVGTLSHLRSSRFRDFEFYAGGFLATRAFVPAKAELSDVFPGVTLWVASFNRISQSGSLRTSRIRRAITSVSGAIRPSPLSKDDVNVTLLLLENFQADDEPKRLMSMSAYSALESLFETLSSNAEIEKTVISSSSQKKRSYLADSPKLSSESAAVSILADLGAQISVERPISCLFRVRRLVETGTFIDEAGMQQALRVFGYPIFITAYDQYDLGASNEQDNQAGG
jgi:hypothetical protein